ncbi:MAG: glycosyltransferase [Proteobacteria bacterium]|nr:glycosyltransferase [Pseudomonadota bacterium]
MQKASYIMTFRQGDGAQRRDNLVAVLAWLAQYPQFEPIVIEQDDAPRLQGALPHPACTQVFAYNPGPFNKSWGLNIGFRLSVNPWLVFADADIVLGDALAEAATHLDKGYQAIKPYRRLIDLDDAESMRVRTGDFDFVPQRDAAAPNREGVGEHIVFAGGVVLIARAAFVRMGGWDERFRGWGGEDDAMSYRLERARVAGIELDSRPAVHLVHPRAQETTFAQPHYADNRALLEDYRRMEDPQLQRFAEIQMQIIGNRDKYRPE